MLGMEVQDLTPAQCVLLAVHLASESNIKALHSFTPARADALGAELVLRILLTYLPEAVDPQEYTNYVEETATRLFVNTEREEVEVNTSPVKDIPDDQAQRRVKKLHLLHIYPPEFPPNAPEDLLTRFLCHRAARIDEQTGLLNLVPALIEPYLDRNDFLRNWYISTVLPMLRLEIEYYPEDESLAMPLSRFEKLSGREGINLLLRKASEAQVDIEDSAQASNLGRDIKGLVGPWMFGHTERKRRKLNVEPESHGETGAVETATLAMRKIALDGVEKDDKTGHDWEHVYQWLVRLATSNLVLVARVVEEWDGPSDVDLGEHYSGGVSYLDEDIQRRLELQYAQAAFASCYAAQADGEETVRAAHAILARLAELLDFIPPPDLATSVESLPKVMRHTTRLDESQTIADLLPDALMVPEHPLTTPKLETYMLLQMMVYSAYQFLGLGHALSLVHVAKLHFYANSDEQLEVLRKLLRYLSRSTVRKDETLWMLNRAKLLWLWNWGLDVDTDRPDEGSGPLGKIPKDVFEEEMLKVFTDASCFKLANDVYISGQTQSTLPLSRVEQAILAKVMEAYDSASNGNKSRGGMKKASDIISAFRPAFPESKGLQQASALVTATHALSFYSLTLEHGVPFQPVSIRVSQDPLSLVSKALEQNPKSYTKLDDLIDIARNLASAGLANWNETDLSTRLSEPSDEQVDRMKQDAGRRVTFMAIEAALREDDFETAYSYIVSRLTPPGPILRLNSGTREHKRSSSRAADESDDDISWRAAFLAGRYRPSTASPPTLRRLEQRTELLSLALLLAPVSALTEILAAWRRCEEETTSLQISLQQAEQEFDDRADKRLSGSSSALPGNFTVSDEQPGFVLNQKRREMGRMGAARGNEDAPLSMFDLTRNAARAFGALPSRAMARTSGEQERSMHESTGSVGTDRPMSPVDGSRVRKRDMVANAVSGGLAQGLGWVLGANPVPHPDDS